MNGIHSFIAYGHLLIRLLQIRLYRRVMKAGSQSVASPLQSIYITEQRITAVLPSSSSSSRPSALPERPPQSVDGKTRSAKHTVHFVYISAQSLFHVCVKIEIQLNWLDMSINEKKSCCIRIGPRCDLKCASITTSNGHNLPWVNEVRYLGI